MGNSFREGGGWLVKAVVLRNVRVAIVFRVEEEKMHPCSQYGKTAATGLGDLQSPPGMLQIVEVAHYEDLFVFRSHPIPTQDKVEPADPQLQRWAP